MVKHRDNGGFTLIEALAAAAILIILLSISAPGVARYKDSLKLSELDNAAREIYMAAENRAVLLGNGSQLDAALTDGEGAASLRYIRETDAAAEELLPPGTVEPALREGQFYIVYDDAATAVTDVFYTEEPGIPAIDDALDMAEDRSVRMEQDPMLGYYGGEQSVREAYTPLPAPEVTVEIRNEERLTVDVVFTVPETALALIGEDWPYTAEQRVQISCNGETRTLLAINPAGASARSPDSRRCTDTSAAYSWVLDALDSPEEKNRHFYQLFDADGSGPNVWGGDFTVTAGITLSAAGHRSAGASGSDTDNSLFARGSDGTTARIETLRHLQNLDSSTSRAGGKTAAVQLADIPCYDNEVYPEYEFVPITNKDLASFDGGRNSRNERNQILHLRVTPDSASAKNAAGLFAESDVKIAFTGVQLIDAETAAGFQPAGALIGTARKGFQAEEVRVVNGTVHSDFSSAGGIAGITAGTTSLKNCRVFWEPEPGQETLRSLLGGGADGYQYRITGMQAGGLIGSQRQTDSGDELLISDSFAATAIQGVKRAGGLLGSSEDVPVTLSNSYADCLLTGNEAGGLMGHTTAETVLANCYAAGFIDMAGTEKAAGFCLGASGITAGNSYAALTYTGDTTGKTIYKLDEGQNAGNFTHTYYLGNAGEFFDHTGGEFPASTYEQMASPEFAEALGDAFAFKEYQTPAVSRNTYPYNLQETRTLTAYSFPGLAKLPHYGDWQGYAVEPCLVYYEEYQDGTHGFSGESAGHQIGQLYDKGIISDGYATALPRSGFEGAFDITYTYFKTIGSGPQKTQQTVSYQTADLPLVAWTRMEGGRTVQEEFYLAPLPEDLVTGGETSKDFYQYLRFEVKSKTSNAVGESYYNPHFAETVKPAAPADPEDPEQIRQYIVQTLIPGDGVIPVSIRTPRHLYHLSQYEDYYSNDRHILAFRQELNLDYRQYTGHNSGGLVWEGGSMVQAPIGNQARPFRGNYDGGCHTIEHVIFDFKDPDSVCLGLFGYTTGNLSNIVYLPDPETAFTVTLEKPSCLGALAGVNGGVMSNCAAAGVCFEVNALDTELYTGGLAGVNRGTIKNCAVELASLTAGVSWNQPVYIGGLAGRNDSSIQNSYVVGRLTAKEDESGAPVPLSGFVCRNPGSIRNSYAAVDLKTGVPHGFCDPAYSTGSLSGACCLWGDFTYRGESFTAGGSPESNGAQCWTYDALTAPGSMPGMSCVSSGFPYPTGVTDSDGQPVHYGQWPIHESGRRDIL